MSKEITVKLKEPVEVGGQNYEKIELRKPKTRDMRNMAKAKGTEIDKVIKLFCDLSELPPEVFDELSPIDFDAINVALEPFLPQQTGSV